MTTLVHYFFSYDNPRDEIKLQQRHKNYQAFLSAPEECRINDRVDPHITTLKNLKSSRIRDQVIFLYVKKDIKIFDTEIKSNLLVTLYIRKFL